MELLFIVLTIFVVIDLASAVVFFILDKRQRKKCTQETLATIVPRPWARGKNYIYTVNGVDYKYPMSVYSSFPINHFTKGDITICYDPNKPKNAYVKNNRFLSIFWLLFFACLVSGIGISLVTIILYLFT